MPTTSLPEIGSRWSHPNGHIYTVLMITNTGGVKADFPITVVYVDDDKNLWSQPLHKWVESKTLIPATQ
jgi:hypothetical protein